VGIPALRVEDPALCDRESTPQFSNCSLLEPILEPVLEPALCYNNRGVGKAWQRNSRWSISIQTFCCLIGLCRTHDRYGMLIAVPG